MTEQTSLQAAPASVSDLLEKIDRSVDLLPKRLKQCASFTRRHLHLIAVSTVADMARAAGVAPSVYMRFCQALGFSGYSEMQALFRERYTEFRPDYERRLAHLREEGAQDPGRLLAEFAESGHKSLIGLANSVTSGTLETIAEGMAAARVVHLVGLRRAFAVVSSMAYLLGKLDVPTILHPGSGMIETQAAIRSDDVLFAVTYAPFSDETIRLAHAAAARGATVYGLTDVERCPIEDLAAAMLIAREDEVAGFRALTASITLSTALAVATGARRDHVDTFDRSRVHGMDVPSGGS